jgi:hypothetical protein
MALMLKFNSYFYWCCFIIKLTEFFFTFSCSIFHCLKLFCVDIGLVFISLLHFYLPFSCFFLTLNCGVWFLFTIFIVQGFWGLQQSRNGQELALCVIGMSTQGGSLRTWQGLCPRWHLKEWTFSRSVFLSWLILLFVSKFKCLLINCYLQKRN